MHQYLDLGGNGSPKEFLQAWTLQVPCAFGRRAGSGRQLARLAGGPAHTLQVPDEAEGEAGCPG